MPLLQKGMSMLSDRMPKVIGPKAHAIIDYAVAGTFFAMAAYFWRRNKRAAISSIVCGAATTVNSMVTDYPGGVWKEMSFQNHGRVDVGLAGLTATIPDMMGFSKENEARFFEVQAVAETLVAGLTDFEALNRTDYYRHSEAA